MVARLPIHLLDPTGASGSLTTPRYDPTLGRVIWTAPGGGGGGGGSAGRVCLSRQVLTGDSAQIAFTGSVPSSGYEHLQVILRTRSTSYSGSAGQDYLRATLNGDTTLGNYTSRTVYTAGSVNNVVTVCAGMVPGSGAPAGSAGELDLLLPAYLGTTWPKSMRSNFGFRFGSTTPSVGDTYCEWAGTAAVTDLVLTLASGGSFVAGTIAYLYGLA